MHLDDGPLPSACQKVEKYDVEENTGGWEKENVVVAIANSSSVSSTAHLWGSL